MRNISYDNITETVIRAYSGAENARTKEIVTLLIQRLHDFVREVELKPQEWEHPILLLGFSYLLLEYQHENIHPFQLDNEFP